MIQDTQEYLQQWEKENNPFYPSEMRWDRLQVNRFLKDYKQQLTLTDVVVPKGTLCCPECKSTDLKVAIHTDYNECNKCYHYWET
jgi:hypothetical protein